MGSPTSPSPFSAKRSRLGKRISEMTHFVFSSSGTRKLQLSRSINQSINLWVLLQDCNHCLAAIHRLTGGIVVFVASVPRRSVSRSQITAATICRRRRRRQIVTVRELQRRRRAGRPRARPLVESLPRRPSNQRRIITIITNCRKQFGNRPHCPPPLHRCRLTRSRRRAQLFNRVCRVASVYTSI